VVARFVRFDGISKAEWAVGSGWFEHDYLPATEGADGFEAAYLFVDLERGAVVSVTLWRDEETAAASEEVVRGYLDHYEEMTGTRATIETFETAVARPPSPAA
jgi:hypothetical protein